MAAIPAHAQAADACRVGKNDPFFTPAGAHAFERNNPNATVKLLDGGHFVLEEAADTIAAEMRALADRSKLRCTRDPLAESA